MKVLTYLRFAFLFCFFSFLSSQKSYSQCFEIESILVDACGAQEGLNEMVRFKVGSTNLNTNTLAISWPNNSWNGLIKNAVTASKVAVLNNDILAAGGCGILIEPTSGILPANATVIVVTSYNLDVPLNPFGPLTSDIYIIFQNSSTTSGHFANFGAGIRTLTMLFGTCSDSVSYDRALLTDEAGVPTASNGGSVIYTPSGDATYINNGCAAPVVPFSVDAGPTLSACNGSTVLLNGFAQGYQSVKWTATSGSFLNSGNLSTNYVINATAGSNIVLTLTATNACGVSIIDTLSIHVTSAIIPDFNLSLSVCNGSTVPILSNTSPNGVIGVWNPSAINNSVGGSYVFTPTTGQCAQPVTLMVNVTAIIIPDFMTSITICAGNTVPVLQAVSPNGISGTWNPPIVNNATNEAYVFTPNPGQCSQQITLNVIIGGSVVPDFDTVLTFCRGANVPVLNHTSPNGISGTWNPAIIDNNMDGSYIFTPDPGQCASTTRLDITIVMAITPDFDMALSLCNGQAAPLLNNLSPNGISGVWNPANIDNLANGQYVFTPDAGQCAEAVALDVTVGNISFDFAERCDNGKFYIYLNVLSDSFDPAEATYHWTNSLGNNIGNDAALNVSDIVANSVETETFPLTYTLMVNYNGCQRTMHHVVYAAFCQIPKGVSPNNDGMNDTFNLTGLGVRELSIYNRFGTKVYAAVNYTNQWAGQSENGNELPDGTYYYVVNKTNGQTETGWVYLNRKYN